MNANPLQMKVTIWDFCVFFDNKDWQAKPQFSTSQYDNIIKMRPFVKEEAMKRKKKNILKFYFKSQTRKMK